MEYTGDVSSYQNDSGIPFYVVYRDIRAGEPFDPTAPLHFLPPKDSDELFEALRFAFPHLDTHSERLRDATIKFLLEEQQAYSTSAPPQPAMPPQVPPQTQDASQSSTRPASSSRLNVWSHATVGTKGKFKYSPSSQASAQSSTLLTKDMPPQEDMTGVFSVSHIQPKQHQRRKMTEKEKADYRKRRMVKACDKCAKRKRKCNHNFLDRLSPDPERESSDCYGNGSRSDIGSPRSSTNSQDQTERQSLQETATTSGYTSRYTTRTESPSNQSTEGMSSLPDAHISNWYSSCQSDFPVHMNDPALQIAASDIITSGESWTSEEITPHDPLMMGDWTTDSPGQAMRSVLRTHESLQFENLDVERRQLSWSHNHMEQPTSCGVSPSYDECLLLEQDGCIISRRGTLLADKQETGFISTLPSILVHPPPSPMYHHEGVYGEQHNGYSSPSTYYGHALQDPEKDPKITADDASSDGESFDDGEMVMDRQMAAMYVRRCRVLNSVLAAWLDSVSTFASVLTLMTCLLRRGEEITAMKGWPMAKWLQEMNEIKATDPLALRFH